MSYGGWGWGRTKLTGYYFDVSLGILFLRFAAPKGKLGLFSYDGAVVAMSIG